MLPIGGMPAIDHVLWECVESGFTELTVVVRPGDTTIETYLCTERSGYESLSMNERFITYREMRNSSRLRFVEENRELGYGSAIPILQLKSQLEREDAFAVIFADDLVFGAAPAIGQVLDQFYAHECVGALAAIEASAIEIANDLGNLIPADGDTGTVFKIGNFVQKPSFRDVQGNKAVVSRLVLSSQIFGFIRFGQSEWDLGEAVGRQIMAGHCVIGVMIEGFWGTVGDPGRYAQLCSRYDLVTKSAKASSSVGLLGAASIKAVNQLDVTCWENVFSRIDLYKSITVEVARDGVLWSGSVLEGYNNYGTDIDVHIFSDTKPKTSGRCVEYKTRGGHIFDVEYCRWDLLEELISNLKAFDFSSGITALRFRAIDLDLLHRIKCGIILSDYSTRIKLAKVEILNCSLAHSRILIRRALHHFDYYFEDAVGALRSGDFMTAKFLVSRAEGAAVDMHLAFLGDTSIKEKWRWKRLTKFGLARFWSHFFDPLDQNKHLDSLEYRLNWSSALVSLLSASAEDNKPAPSPESVEKVVWHCRRLGYGVRVRRYADAWRIFNHGQSFKLFEYLAEDILGINPAKRSINNIYKQDCAEDIEKSYQKLADAGLIIYP